jgi:hypothetical protein
LRVGDPQFLNIILDMKVIIYMNIINHAKFIIGKCVNNATEINQKIFDRSRTIIGI